MRKIQDVIGLPVLDLSTGKKIGVVKDFYFDKNKALTGIAVESQHLFSKVHFLAFENIGAIGEDAVTVGTKRLLSPLNPNSQYYGFQTGKKMFNELPVITANGNEMGHIMDVYFHEEMGKIIGYELSDGFLTDITEGRKIIKNPKRAIIGEDVMVIPMDEIKGVISKENSLKL